MWRNAAGIFLCSSNSNPGRIESLLLQRSSRAGFMANVYAFPGGNLDKVDYSSQWTSVLFGNVLNSSSNQLQIPLYSNWKDPSISGQVAYRICAIRELFEETGILLARRKDDVNNSSGSDYSSVYTLSDDEIQAWQKKVHENSYNFITMCNELNCVPDVSSLIEWSNWLTPFNSPRRYDTIFYLACLNTKPLCFPDSSEVSNFAWLTPQNAIHMQFKDDIRLAPPQFCDLSLANRFCSLSQIKDFTLYNLRNKTLQRNVSIRIRDKDGQRVVVGEGDDLYPSVDQSIPPSKGFMYSVDVENNTLLFKINDDGTDYEYNCVSHSNEELYQLTSNFNRVYSNIDRFSKMTYHNTTSSNS